MHSYGFESTKSESTGLPSLLGKGLSWFLIGKLAGLEGTKLRDCAIIGTIADCALDLNLDVAIGQVIEQARQEQIRQETATNIESIFQPKGPSIEFDTSESQTPLLPKTYNQNIGVLEGEEERKWRKVIIHPSVVLILGKRGSGKSALGYYLLMLLHTAYPTYLVGVSETAQHLLPDWIGIVSDLQMLPPKSVALVDEAYLHYHARQSNTDASIVMSKLLNLSRQKSQTIIFISQEARQLDRNIVSSADVIVFKDLGILQTDFDRRELNRIVLQAKQVFDSSKGDRRSWNYVYSPNADFIGPLKNTLPSFWSKKLSNIFANNMGENESAIKPARNMTLDDRIKLAKELCRNNHSMGQIAGILNVSKGTVYNYLNNYPYRNESSC